ncbi:hypothetical protein [Gordonibacter sp.]|uniref:hypothetical protein n=1 Tax=Gordonibacter sp. TaxID=1968902 RepID=UPI002FC67757
MEFRSDITNGLSELLAKRLDGDGKRWAREVKFCNPECRVDFVAYKAAPYGWSCIGGIEHGVASFYEVKSCLADYNSGHGLNFYGDENWLVMPAELSRKLRGNLPMCVGVMIPVPSGSSVFAEIEKPTPYKGQTDGWGLHIQCRPSEGRGFFRRYSITEILAAMLYAK